MFCEFEEFDVWKACIENLWLMWFLVWTLKALQSDARKGEEFSNILECTVI